MSRLKLLILDANVVIHLHELGIWSKLIGICDVHLPRTVVSEVSYYEADGEKCYIDIEPDVAEQRVHVFDVALSDIKEFRDQFDPLYVEGLDPGECEALAYLGKSAQDFLISSGDAIVYRVLGRLNRSDQGSVRPGQVLRVEAQRDHDRAGRSPGALAVPAYVSWVR